MVSIVYGQRVLPRLVLSTRPLDSSYGRRKGTPQVYDFHNAVGNFCPNSFPYQLVPEASCRRTFGHHEPDPPTTTDTTDTDLDGRHPSPGSPRTPGPQDLECSIGILGDCGEKWV